MTRFAIILISLLTLSNCPLQAQYITWSPLLADYDASNLFSIQPLSNQIIVAVGDFGVVRRSADAGRSWNTTYAVPSGVTLRSITVRLSPYV